MALNRSSKFNIDDGLFKENTPVEKVDTKTNNKETLLHEKKENLKEEKDTNSKKRLKDVSPIKLDTPNLRVYKKEEKKEKPIKPRINTKSKTYTIDDDLYNLMAATVKLLRENNVRNEENGSLISESAFIRKAIRLELNRLFDANGEEFKKQAEEYIKIKETKPVEIKY